MPNKPRKEKRTCAQCGTRTRRWREGDDGTITCDPCADMILGMCPQTPQVVLTPPQGHMMRMQDGSTAQDANVPQAGAGEEQHGYMPSASFMARHGIKPVIRAQEVRLGTVEQEFDLPLSPHEINQKGAQLSGAVKEIEQIEAEKARAKREFGARLKVARQSVAALAQAVATGTVTELRQAAMFLDRDAQRVNYRDPITGTLYASRAVEPGEQFHLPMEGATNA